MAYGKKTTTAPQIGDILWADADVEVADVSYLDQVAFTAKKGDDLGEITDITSTHYEVEQNYYVAKSAKTHVMANPDYDYQTTSNTDNGATSNPKGFWAIIQSALGFGTELLKKTNGSNNSTTTTNKTTKTPADNGNGSTPDPNAAGNNSSNTTKYLFIGAGVLLLVLLIVIFWKPKSEAPQQGEAQVIKV